MQTWSGFLLFFYLPLPLRPTINLPLPLKPTINLPLPLGTLLTYHYLLGLLLTYHYLLGLLLTPTHVTETLLSKSFILRHGLRSGRISDITCVLQNTPNLSYWQYTSMCHIDSIHVYCHYDRLIVFCGTFISELTHTNKKCIIRKCVTSAV